MFNGYVSHYQRLPHPLSHVIPGSKPLEASRSLPKWGLSQAQSLPVHRPAPAHTMIYPRVNSHSYGKSPCLMAKSTISNDSMVTFHSKLLVYQRVFRFQVSFRFLDFAIFRHHPTQRNAMVSWQEAPPLWIPPSSIDLEDSLWFFPPLFWRMPKYNIIHLYMSHVFFTAFPFKPLIFLIA